jgi:diphosphomevalonate decarboxylase
MNPHEYVADIIQGQTAPAISVGQSFAPSNIALCKYWGKHDTKLNIPVTDSLSLSLGSLGADTQVSCETSVDEYSLNGMIMAQTTSFSSRLRQFLDLFRSEQAPYFKVDTTMNIPLAAGLASSACGFAALTQALDQLFAWQLDKQSLSQVSRLGSGSACRSHWHGFVHWHKGSQTNGRDCFATPISTPWPQLRLAIVKNAQGQKHTSSRQAMALCQKTSADYAHWPTLTQEILHNILAAIAKQDITTLGENSQKHAEQMHLLMHQAVPAIHYETVETLAAKKILSNLQHRGLGIYYTQDAGPHLKLIFLQDNCDTVRHYFPQAQIINPWQETVVAALNKEVSHDT